MNLWSHSFEDGAAIPEKNAFGKQDAKEHIALAGNESPHLAWSDLPDGTRSLAILCIDPDVPSRPDDVNQEGKTVPKDLPRVDFSHWTLVDLAPTVTEIPEGKFSKGVTPKGKSGPDGPDDTRQGVNDYTNWFAGDAEMAGQYFGYDGPCPPWNDELLHRYRFTVYALDVERLPIEGTFTAADVEKAMERHVLGRASITGTYTLNPGVRSPH